MGAISFTKKIIFSEPNGFTLLELIVVIAGLGILSSLALPSFIALLDSNKVDEIKALLNSAAADCLQKARSETDPIINDEIISDGIIEKIGYKIDRTNSILNANGDPKCSMLWLEPINGEDDESIRYNIGFSLSDGILDKLASTTVTDEKPDCIKWAGKCEFSKAAKILEEHKEKIREAQKTCNLKLTEWKEKNKMNPNKFKQWDTSKGPDTCPKKPPKSAGDTYNPETSTCTTAGCDPGIPVWGLWDQDKGTGTVYYSETEYKEARKKLIGIKCDNQIRDEYEGTKFTNPSSAGVALSECQDQNYWFVDGENKGSKEEWLRSMCTNNKQALLSTTHNGPVEYCETSPIYICGGEEIIGANAKARFETCLANDKNALCTTALNNDAAKRSNGGPYNSPTPSSMSAPIGDDCNLQYWYCKNKIYREEGQYKQDKRCQEAKNCFRPNTICDTRPRNPICISYSKCMGRI